MRRLFLWIGLPLLLLLAAGVGLAGFLVATERGLQWLLPRIAGYIPGEFSYESARGRLIGPLTIEGIRYETGPTTITLQRLRLDWMPYFLLSGELYINELKAQHLAIESARQPQPAEERFSLPDVNLPPLTVSINDATVADITYLRADDPTPLVINRVSLAMSTGLNTVFIRDLGIESPVFTAAVKGRVRPHGEYPHTLDVRWSFRPEGSPTISGNGSLTGSVRRIALDQRLSGPAAAHVAGTITDPFGALRWNASAEVLRFDPRSLRSEWPSLTLSGTFKSSGDPSAFNVDGAYRAAPTPYGAASGLITLSKTERLWSLERLSAELEGSAARLSLSGTYAPAAADSERGALTVKGEWSNLTWPLKGAHPLASSKKGSFAAAGTPENYTYEAAFDFAGRSIPEGRWQGRGSGGSDSVTIALLKGELLGGTVSANGKVRWKPDFSWQLTASGRGLNPGELRPEWQGRIALQATAAGRVEGGVRQTTVEVRRAEGMLRGAPFSAAFRLIMSGDTYRLPAARLSTGGAVITASGTIADTWDLAWTVSAPNLAALHPAVKGALDGSGSLRGLRKAPLVTARLDGSRLQYKRYGARTLRAEGTVDMSDASESRILLKAGELRVGGPSLKAAALSGSGRLSAHTVTAALDAEGLSIPLALRGGYARGVWKGSVEQARLISDEYGVWALERPGPLTVNAAAGTMSGGWWCLSNQDNRSSRLCLQGAWSGDRGSGGEITATSIPLAFLKPLLPPALSVAGVFSGSAEATYNGASLRGRLALTTPPGTLSYPITDKERATLGYKELSLSAELSEKALTARLDVPLSEGGYIKASATLPSFSPFTVSWDKQQIRGSIAAEIKRIDIIATLFPALQNTQGALKANLTFSGAAARPDIAGTAGIENGSALVPDLGIRLTGINLAVAGTESGEARITGSAQSGPGSITLRGAVTLSPEKGWPLTLHITGKGFEMLRRPDARVLASPDLLLSMKGRKLDISGEILIPQAMLRPRSGGAGVVPVSEDVVIVRRDEQKRRAQEEERWKIHSRVRIILGEDVRFDGFGLTASITGSALVLDEPGQPTTARGELRIVNGRYETYGQTLQIDRGRVFYVGGPIGNPALDIRAVRKVEEVTVGVTVQGTLRTPRLTLFSDPAMEQTQILSYLVLGQPLQGASAEEGRILYRAAQSLTLGGGEFLAQRIGQLFGIRDVRVQTGSTLEEASLVLGTYLSPRLYVSYGIGLFEPAGRLHVRYDLSKRLQLRVESGIESGADLLYKFER